MDPQFQLMVVVTKIILQQLNCFEIKLSSFAKIAHIEVDQKYIRPTEVDALIGDPSKVTQELKWKAKTHWKELAELMVDADIEVLKK